MQTKKVVDCDLKLTLYPYHICTCTLTVVPNGVGFVEVKNDLLRQQNSLLQFLMNICTYILSPKAMLMSSSYFELIYFYIQIIIPGLFVLCKMFCNKKLMSKQKDHHVSKPL